MQVNCIAECQGHSAILLPFIKLQFAIKIFVLSIFEWPFYTGFTVKEPFSNSGVPNLDDNLFLSSPGHFPQP